MIDRNSAKNVFYRGLIPVVFLLFILTSPTIRPVFAKETPSKKKDTSQESKHQSGSISLEDEITQLKKRVDLLENKRSEVDVSDHAEIGHKLHPIHTTLGAKFSGGLTMIYQRSQELGTDEGGATMSADLFIESPLGGHGTFLLRFDVQQGNGLTNIPSLFTNPNGSTTGTNSDIESWDNPDEIHLNEARFHGHFLDGSLQVDFGHIDLTAYFDTNHYANSEMDQFIAPIFTNNVTIDWGGTENALGPGLVLAYTPSESVTWAIGGMFAGDGDYNEVPNDPWLATEIGLKPTIGHHAGHYRLYFWQQNASRCPVVSVQINGVCDPTAGREKNRGVGLSFNQELSDAIGLWGRFGTQKADVAQFDLSFSLGIRARNKIFGRADDVLGLAYGLTIISEDFRAFSGRTANEHYAELYYRFVAIPGTLEISPDIQVVINPGGDPRQDAFTLVGLRTQAYF